MPKFNKGATARDGRQPDDHTLTPSMGQPAPGVNGDPLSMAIRAAVADALAPVIDQLLEAAGSRALPRYIDRSELCQMLGVSAPTIRALEAEGLPCVRLGEVRRYPLEGPGGVIAWLASRGTP